MKPFSVLLLVGALFIAVAVLTSHWFAGGSGDSSFHSGLFSSGYCHGDDCESELLVKFLFRGGGFKTTVGIVLAMLTGLAGIATAVLTVITAFATTAGRRGPLGVAFIFAIATGAAGLLHLVILGGLHSLDPTNWGFSLFLFMLGIGGTITGCVMAMKRLPAAARPMMMGYGGQMNYGMPGMPPIYGQQPGMPPPYGQPPGYPQQAQPPPPPCNQCGGQTQLVQQYNKLFCGRCNRYLV